MAAVSVTLITACDRNYLDRVEATIPTWRHVKGFTGPIICFVHGWNRRSLTRSGAFKALRDLDVQLIKWSPPGMETQRERMLTSLILGAAEHVKTEWHVKLDSETVAVDDQPWLETSWLEDYDLVAPGWSYTKPGIMIERIDWWMNGLAGAGKIPRTMPSMEKADRTDIEKRMKDLDKKRKRHKKGDLDTECPACKVPRGLTGCCPERTQLWDAREALASKLSPYATWNDAEGNEQQRWYVDRNYVYHGDPKKPHRMKHKASRICSWISLVRTELCQEIAECLPLGRLPAPSHDSLLWRFSERLGKRILQYSFKDKGWRHMKRGYKEASAEAIRKIGGDNA